MSFTVTKEVKELVSYPELGASCQLVTVSKEVTYSAKRLVSLSDAGAQVLFDVYVGDSVTPGEHYHMFSYSGAGNPLDEAELSLKMNFDSQELSQGAE
ncbi:MULTISPECIES: hypothetical protein [Klebsiella pneumoniae complex]|uniref:hypothetical protein n=1 Tax=Klebsiella pneumoniae complex TaxID=3390273 RepID=UPI0006BDB2CA|nr:MULTISPECIES: hypothetical protein [Klebsiella]BAS42864.1 hypothetical protein KOJKO3_c4850 [Klebsiella oxytoca]MDV1351045.1 hypothetical protein [Klebsiella quasipneumoniae subsp. similipneumoniae]MDV1365790.1 hypothetical protein [Klebsiella quasipneumoniae subsp. similipneumoniae]PLE00092.1 hypothetical protein B6I64_11035 [Klebsiella pneumoniae]QFZ67684.1 hypothetical protein GFK78_03370 [Klebsiella quasipneumoniae]